MITTQQWREIRKIQEGLKEQIGNQAVTKESIAAAMQQHNSNLDYDTALFVCERISDGREVFCQSCSNEDLKEPGYTGRMLDRITEKMDQEGQRKGFYLQCMDSFGQNQNPAEETAVRAALPEQELREILITRMEQFAKSEAALIEDITKDYSLPERSGNFEMEDAELEDELFLFAAAEYLASLNGILPLVFGENPELLGIGAAAQMAMAEYGSEGTAENIKWYKDPNILEIIILTDLSAAFTIGSVVIGVAAEAVLDAMAAGTLGFILSVVLEVGLCMAFAIGIMGLFCGIGCIVEECIMRYREHKAEANAESKAASAWTQEAEEGKFVYNS